MCTISVETETLTGKFGLQSGVCIVGRIKLIVK